MPIFEYATSETAFPDPNGKVSAPLKPAGEDWELISADITRHVPGASQRFIWLWKRLKPGFENTDALVELELAAIHAERDDAIRRASEQSEYIQSHGLTEIEMNALRARNTESEAMLIHQQQRTEAAEARCARMAEALVAAAIPLEALRAAIVWELAPEMRDEIAKAVDTIRTALTTPDAQFSVRMEVENGMRW